MGTFLTSIAGVTFYTILPVHEGLSTSPDWLLGFLFGTGGFAGMYIGARLQKYVPQKFIKLGLGLISWHDLRHSCGTIARQELPPEVVQRHLRHANISTTLSIYSHLTDENAARTVEGSFKWPLPDVLPEGSENQTVQ